MSYVVRMTRRHAVLLGAVAVAAVAHVLAAPPLTGNPPSPSNVAPTMATAAQRTPPAGLGGRGRDQIGEPRGRGVDGRGVDGRGRGGRGSSEGIEDRSYRFTDTNESLPYALFVSSKVNRRRAAPLVIALHGAGVPPGIMLRFLRDAAQDDGYIVAAPMGYSLRGWYGAQGPTPPGADPPNLGELSEKDVMNVLALMRKEFVVDDSRIYLVGQSMGGGGAVHLAAKYPDLWAAVALSAPAIPPSYQPTVLERIAHLPVILVHGDADNAVPIERVRPWAAAMRALKMTHEFHEIAGGGHSDAIGTGAPRIFKFFNKHQRGGAATTAR